CTAQTSTRPDGPAKLPADAPTVMAHGRERVSSAPITLPPAMTGNPATPAKPADHTRADAGHRHPSQSTRAPRGSATATERPIWTRLLPECRARSHTGGSVRPAPGKG